MAILIGLQKAATALAEWLNIEYGHVCTPLYDAVERDPSLWPMPEHEFIELDESSIPDAPTHMERYGEPEPF
jgi:hypothetical protein